MDPIDVSTVAHVIQLSVAPVFLLSGVGAMLGVLSNRLARLVDRARNLEGKLKDALERERDQLHADLYTLARRSRLIYVAMTLCTLCALLVCSVIVALFASALANRNLGLLIAALFIFAMLAFIGALLAFMREVFLATRSLRIGPH